MKLYFVLIFSLDREIKML